MEDPPGIFKCALRCKTVTVQWLHDPMEIPKEKSESRKEHSVRSYPYPFFLAMLEAAILLWYNEAVQHLNMGGWYMAANYSFRAYIKNNYFDRVYAAATRFIETEYARIYTSINRLPEPANISLQDVAIKSIRIGNQNDLNIAFDMLVAASLSIRESIAKAPISQAICLNICCQADLATDLLDLKVTEVRLSEGHVIFYDTLLSDTLVPIIRKADLERVANKLLKKYYPDALTRPMAIDPYAFADKMGLIVVKRHLSTDYSIFGQIFFCDADDGIKAGTICVDPDANYAYRGGNVRTSIIHECVHWALHRKALAFRRLHDAGLTDLSCAADDKRTEGLLKDVSLLEWQANALAARIQMPLAMFRKQAKETLAKLHRDTGKTDTLDVIEDVIEELARFYGVSRLAAKIRMIEAGFSEAAGAYNYIDGHYAAPHKIERNLTEANVVFSIDASDAAGLIFENEAFRDLIEGKGYLYVDGHFVLNDDAYIARTDSGTLSLTPYALRHMEECCIPFKVCAKEHGDISVCDITTLFSKSSSKREYYRFVPQRCISGGLWSNDQIIDLKTEREQDMAIDQMLTADAKLCKELPRGPREALDYLIHTRAKKSYTALSEETGINKQTIGRLTNPHSTTPRAFPNLDTLVLLLFALHTGPLTSAEIIRLSDFNLNPIDNVRHRWIVFALNFKYTEPLEDILAFLERHGVDLRHGK